MNPNPRPADGRCHYCGMTLPAAVPADVTICHVCWIKGRMAAENMADVLAELGEATGTPWEIIHTGGNCFAAVTTATTTGLDGRRDYDRGPCMVLTADGDTLAGDHGPEDVEGWDLGVYPDGFDGDPVDFAEDLAYEELVGYVREARGVLTGEGV